MTQITKLQQHSQISITIPCLNESKYIGTTLDNLESLLSQFKDYEIIVINDGSTDETGPIVEKRIQINSKINLINHSTNQGRGYSIKEGFSQSKFEYLICFNGKHDISKEEMKKIFDQIGMEELIISVQNNTKERPWIRRFFSNLYTSILNFSFGLNLKYYNGSSVIKKSHFERLSLHTNSYALDAEILIKLLKSQVSYLEIPVNDIIEDERNTRSLSLSNICGVMAFYLYTFFEIHILRKRY